MVRGISDVDEETVTGARSHVASRSCRPGS